MFKSIVVLSSGVVAGSAESTSKLHPVREEIVDEIKKLATSWTPREVSDNHLRHVPVNNIQMQMGSLGLTQFGEVTKKAEGFFDYIADTFGFKMASNGSTHEDKKLKSSSKPAITRESMPILGGMPPEFDWRVRMPDCIGAIEDQGECGSCWAFTSSGLLADRFCIHTDGAIKTRFSPQEMVNCNYENFGCMGGYLMTTIDYLQTEGLVSNECVPYMGDRGMCTYRCSDDGKSSYDKYYCAVGSLSVLTSYEQIMMELISNGPLMLGLRIFEDFMNYEHGVYKYTTGDEIGGHAMKLIGYGYDDLEGLYWVM